MTKNYILDTNVLISNPDALSLFEENHLYIPFKVLDELDKFKSGREERNVSARAAIRSIERIVSDALGEITEKEKRAQTVQQGIPLKSGGRLFFLDEEKGEEHPQNLAHLFAYFDPLKRVIRDRLGYADHDIIGLVEQLERRRKGEFTCLVTKDINLRIKCSARGLRAEDFEHDKANFDLPSLFSYDGSFSLEEEELALLHTAREIDLPERLREQVQVNQYLTLVPETGGNNSYAQYKKGKIRLLNPKIPVVEDIKPRNFEQRALLEACLDEDIKMISALGQAGTGKTLIALVAGLHQVISDDAKYDRLVVFRPLVEVSSTMGFLPGSKEEKMDPHYGPIKKLVEFILGQAAGDILQEGRIEYTPVNFIRGDTLNNTYILVDEAQNFAYRELKTIATRPGTNCKFVVTGDPFQCDLPLHNDERDNAISRYTSIMNNLTDPVERALFTYVILHEVERGQIAGVHAKNL